MIPKWISKLMAEERARTRILKPNRNLAEDYNKLYSEHGELKKRGEQLVPLVIKHFNDYVNATINPQLPEGFSLKPSTGALYSDGKFKIYTGLYQTQSGTTKGPLEIEHIVTDLLRKYQEQTPWVDKIFEGFSLSR